MDIPVYAGSGFVGYLDEDEVRQILSRSADAQKLGRAAEARLLRKQKRGRIDLRLILIGEDVIHKTRALCNTSTQSALSPTQQEELYSGSRKMYTDTPVYFPPLTVVRKIRTNKHGERFFQNWGERDRFPDGRFNPDRIPAAVFRSEADYRAAAR
jgi:hypothetical protein